MTKRLAIGFDGMCSDLSLSGLGDQLEEIKNRWPFLSKLTGALAQGRDEELTCEASRIPENTFSEIIETLKTFPGVTQDIHIGANSALEAVTAASLLSAPAPPVSQAQVDYLGFWSPLTLSAVPEAIPKAMLSHAKEISNSQATSLIIPHRGRRAILSFGGNPRLRSISPSLRKYLDENVPDYLSQNRPDFLLIVGTATTWSSGEKEDFLRLERTIQAAQRQGTKVVVDLGGLGSWSENSLKMYFSVIEKADILSMNESELGFYFNKTTGNPPPGQNAEECFEMVRKVIGKGQGFLVHTPLFQIASGINGPVRRALEFAGKAASCRAHTGKFPTAAEVISADLPVSSEGKAQLENVPHGFEAVPGYSVEVKNPVGLGDTWTCAFMLAFLGGTR